MAAIFETIVLTGLVLAWILSIVLWRRHLAKLRHARDGAQHDDRLRS